MRRYLKTGDCAYSTGAWLRWSGENGYFLFAGTEDDTYFDGKLVQFDNEGDITLPYVEDDVDVANETMRILFEHPKDHDEIIREIVLNALRKLYSEDSLTRFVCFNEPLRQGE